MKRTISLGLLATLFLTTPAWAYKEQIHRVVSKKAFDAMTASLKPHLGIDKTTLVGGEQLRVLVGQGAYDEDDFPNSLNHFFDPENDAPLSVPTLFCLPQGATARDWALGGLGNQFTTTNARQYYEAALMAPNQAVRDINLRLLFLSLGHSIHLVQDMAQPEHVRNDQHLVFMGVQYGYPVASLYEEWGLVNLLGANPTVPYNGYPNVNLPRSSDYFASADRRGLAQFANNFFVTQDTNYDDEQQIGKCEYYSSPKIADAVPRTEVVNEAVRDSFGGIYVLPISERIYTSWPWDSYLKEQETDPDHTFLSSLDLETRFLTGTPKFSLADASLQTRAGLLIPRAVGYSAGYLDHFFRGSIAVDWTRNNNTGLYNIKITNTSAEAVAPDAIIRAVYVPGSNYTGFGSGNDIVVILNGPLASYAPGFAGLPPGGMTEIPAFSIPYLKSGDTVTSFERRVVIRGRLGEEDNDIVGLVQAGCGNSGLCMEITWDGTFFVAEAAYDYPFNLTNQRYIQASSAQPGGDPFASVPNSRVLAAGPGLLSIGVNPVPPGTTYRLDASLSEHVDKVIHGKVTLDGKVISDRDYLIPACTTIGYCSTIVTLGYFP